MVSKRRSRRLRGGSLTSLSKLINHATFINISHTLDKLQQIQGALRMFAPEQMSFIPDTVGHIPAVRDEQNPELARAKSHMNTILRAKEQGCQTILIAEDNAKWAESTNPYQVLERLMAKPYDGIFLNEENPSLAYILARPSYDKLILTLAEAIANMVKGRTSEQPVVNQILLAGKNHRWHTAPLMVSR